MAFSEDALVPRAERRVGQTVHGKWTLDALLGVGGMAAVYSATHRNGHRVAVKMLHPELSTDDVVRARFLREGHLANAVEHPGAVRVHDDGVADDGAVYFVMDLLEGETIEQRWLAHDKALPVAEVVSIADQALDVLGAAHARDIVHRDVKPENLFLTRDGEIKVLDFGIARLRTAPVSTTTTMSGSMLGTPAFMAPEQALGRHEEVDGRTDVYGLAATMFALLSGQFVHEGRTGNEQIIAAATRRARSISEVAPDLEAPLARVVDRALAFTPDERFANAHEMQAALRDAWYAVHPDALAEIVPAGLDDDVRRGAAAASPIAAPESLTRQGLGAAPPPETVRARGPKSPGPERVATRPPEERRELARRWVGPALALLAGFALVALARGPRRAPIDADASASSAPMAASAVAPPPLTEVFAADAGADDASVSDAEPATLPATAPVSDASAPTTPAGRTRPKAPRPRPAATSPGWLDRRK